MAFIKINSILKKRGQNEVRIIPAAVNGARIKVLVGSCAHCAKLRDNVIAAMKQANINTGTLRVYMLIRLQIISAVQQVSKATLDVKRNFSRNMMARVRAIPTMEA